MTLDAPPIEAPFDVVDLIERERAALLDVLRSMSDDDWRAPSPCPGWSVHDVVLHVLGDDLGVLARQRDHHHGTPGPDTNSEVAFEAFLDDLNEQWVTAMRRVSPRTTIDLLRDTGEQLVEFYRHTDGAVHDAMVGWAGTDALPRWFDHAREFTERWVHHQQVLEAIGASPWAEPDMVGAVLDTFVWAYPYRLGHLTRPVGVTAGVDVTGPVARTWRWASTGSSWAAAPDATEASTLLTMTADQAWRLLTNGLAPADWPAVDPSADSAIARTLLRTRAILGTPNG